MGLDVYVGPLIRYYTGDWETIVQQIGRETGMQKASGRATRRQARVGEWLKPTVCKIVALTGYAGSNPAPGTSNKTPYD